MKKRIYQAVAINKVNIERLRKFTIGKRIVFAVDVAKIDFYGAFFTQEKEVLQTIKWKSPSQVKDMLELLRSLGAKRLEVVLEPTGTYGATFREQIEKQGFPAYLMSPKRCHDAREIFDGVPSSHDAKAAAIIGKLHLEGLSKPWPQKDEQQRQLQSALSMVNIYHRQYYDNLNRLEARLAEYWPELLNILTLTSATIPKFLMKYGSPRKVADDREGARLTMKKAGRNALSHTKIEEVLESASVSIGVSMIVEEEEALQELANEIERNRLSLQQAKKKVDAIIVKPDQSAGITHMSRAVGVVTCAVMLCKLGDPKQYDSAGAWLKAAGLNLKERSSGKYQGVLKITKRGPGTVRSYLYMAALRFIGHDEIALKWYVKKVKRDGGKKGRAIVALMRKLLVGLWRVGRDSVAFDSAKLFDQAKLSLN